MLALYTDLVLGLTVFQSLFFFIFLATHRKGRYPGNRILAVYLLAIFLMLCNDVLFRYDLYLTMPYLSYQGTKFIFLVGPFLYFYTKSLTQKRLDLKWSSLCHLLPFAVFAGVMFFAFDLKSSEEQIRLLTTDENILHPSVSFAFLMVYYLQLIAYVAVSLRLLHGHGKRIRQVNSGNDRNLSWLRFVLWGFGVIWLFDIGMEILKELYSDWQTIYGYLAALSRTYTFSYIMVFVFQGLRRPDIFDGSNGTKYEGSSLDEDTKAAYLQKLLSYMQTEKPFLNPDLSVGRIADDIGIAPRYLSQIINEKLNRNFFDFVNGYRIDEAKKRLTETNGHRITVLEVLYDVGFNSKSSFNTAFKKHTRLTPSEYKRQTL